MSDASPDIKPAELPECFILMPFSDQDGYEPGHFGRICRDIFEPACKKAGFRPRRADSSMQTSLIHLDILNLVLDAPMALCDLSTHNSNVIFELGMRQAFDKPVVLVQEVGTKRMFDINGLRTHDYRKGRLYDEVNEDQEKIAQSLRETFEASKKGTLVNSIVRLLSIGKAASFDNVPPASQDDRFQWIMTAISDLQDQIRQSATNYSLASPFLNAGSSNWVLNPGLQSANIVWSSVGDDRGFGKSHFDATQVDDLAFVVDWIRQRCPALNEGQTKIIIRRALDTLSLTLERLAIWIKAGGVEIRISGPSVDDISLAKGGLTTSSGATTTVTPPPGR
jgi:hypothetical protein